MHEWALAEAVVLTAGKVAKEKKFREIKKITIKLGGLQQIEKETFEYIIREIIASQNALFKKVKIEFQDEKTFFRCRNCGHEWVFDEGPMKLNVTEAEAIHFVPEVAHVYIRCSQCKSSDFEIASGRGVWIDSITGEAD